MSLLFFVAQITSKDAFQNTEYYLIRHIEDYSCLIWCLEFFADSEVPKESNIQCMVTWLSRPSSKLLRKKQAKKKKKRVRNIEMFMTEEVGSL